MKQLHSYVYLLTAFGDPLINDTFRQATVIDLPEETNLKSGMFLKAAINTSTNRKATPSIRSLDARLRVEG